MSDDKLRAAFEKVHEQIRKEMDARRAEFANKLAEKLGISEDKVTDALGDLPRHRRHRP